MAQAYAVRVLDALAAAAASCAPPRWQPRHVAPVWRLGTVANIVRLV